MRFDARDWNGSQRDAVERIELYDRFVNQTIAELREALGAAARGPRRCGGRSAANSPRRSPTCPTRSSSRRSSAPSAAGCSAPSGWRRTSSSWPPTSIRSPTSIPTVGSNTYLNHGSLSLLFEDLLGDVRFRSPWRDLDKSIAHVAGEVQAHLHARGERRPVEKVEVIRPVFYQISRAYVVGRLVGHELLVPLVIALKNSDGGVLVDAVMLAEDDVSIVFSFTRSYLPRRPRARRRGGGVPEVDHAAQAGERAVHGARASAPGQDRALSRADAQPRAHSRPVRTRSRGARPGDGVLYAALLRRGVQGDPRPLRPTRKPCCAKR